MASQYSLIKELSSYSEEAMYQAGNRTSTDIKSVNEQIRPILKALREVKSGPRTQKQKTTARMPSADEMFCENILPAIRKKMEEIDEKQLEEVYTLQIDFEHNANFEKMSMPDLINAHREILGKENMATKIKLVLQYQRGMLYISAAKKEMNFERDLNVPYSTARRYMTLAIMIKTWPMLLVCDLSFSQLTKHKNRLQEALKKEPKLDASLREDLLFKVQGTNMSISAFDGEVVLPTEKQNVETATTKCQM
jgi:hypothetical protein